MSRLTPLLARGVTLAASFVFTILVGRILGASGSGTLLTWMAIVALAGMIGRGGTDTYVLKVGSGTSDDPRFPWRWLARRCMVGSLGAAAVTMIVMAVANSMDVATIQPRAGSVLIATIPLTCYAILVSALLRSNRRPAAGAFAEMGLSQLIAIPLLLVAVTQTTVSVTDAALAYLLATIATALFAHGTSDRLRTSVDRAVTTRERSSVPREMSHMMASSVLFYCLTWMPLIILAAVSTPAESGYFAASNRFASLLNLIPTLQLTALLPRIAQLAQDGQLRKVNVIMRRMSFQAAAVCIPIAVITTALPHVPMALFGDTFEPAVETLRILGPIQSLIIILGPVSLVMTVVGLERVSTRLAVAAVVIAGPVLAVTGSALGSVGMAVAAGSVQLAFAVAGALALRRRGICSSFLVPEPEIGRHA